MDSAGGGRHEDDQRPWPWAAVVPAPEIARAYVKAEAQEMLSTVFPHVSGETAGQVQGKSRHCREYLHTGTWGTEEFLHMISVKQPEGKPFCFNESIDEEL